jgi:hypothetical protein
VGTFRNSYHPERHYMRGPGPKWHEKHKAALHQAASAQPDPELRANLQQALAKPVASPRPAWERASKLRHDLRYAVWILPLTAAALLGFVVVAAFA